MAAGDLSLHVPVRNGDTSSLLAHLEVMRASLSRTIGELNTAAEQVSSASHEIATGNADLSSRTEQQASSLEQTAASMEELSATVKHNADAARQAVQMAQATSDVAEGGGQMMGDVVATMQRISQSSQRIGEIIGVIDGIAFQTNILALNAAVEAARAGEQGRGFAVVASEVRALAQRSAQAAHEIKDLIGASVANVQGGGHLVDSAGKTMQEIVDQVRGVTQLAGEISRSTSEQSSGIGQVNDAVLHLEQVTQQNAALVEQSAAAAESLRDQAARLQQAVAVFRPSPAHQR